MPKKKTTKKTVKKNTRTSGKKSKLDSMAQVHGKTDKVVPTTLDQIWGDDGVWKYSTMKADEYKVQLDEYNLTDLQRHASKVGIIPIESRVRLQETLMREFKKHVSAYNVPNDPAQDTEISEEAMKILKEGR
tara:strand:+ start:290 stop:685 length:396 start_codon:yes stop_codon:yes gene_type:complete